MGKERLSGFLMHSPRLVPQGLNPTCQEIVTVERTFVSNKSNGKNVVAPDNNRRISGMLKVYLKVLLSEQLKKKLMGLIF